MKKNKKNIYVLMLISGLILFLGSPFLIKKSDYISTAIMMIGGILGIIGGLKLANWKTKDEYSAKGQYALLAIFIIIILLTILLWVNGYTLNLPAVF